MSITYTTSLEDYQQFNRQFFKRNRKVSTIRFLLLFAPLVAAVVIYLTHSIVAGITCYVVSSIVWTPIYSYLRRRSERKAFEHQNLHLSRSISLSPEGITTITPTSTSTLWWTAILKVYDDHDSIYLLTGASKGVFIPKSAFSTTRDAAEFLLTAQSLWYGNARHTESMQ